MTEEEFCERFVAHMVRSAGFEHFDDGTPVRRYAEETAPTYWEDLILKRYGETPEECADADMSYWGEE